MGKPSVVNLNDLFGYEDDNIEDETTKSNEQQKGTTEVDLSQLVPFSNHPFKLYQGERLNDMVESIKEHGIITPLIVRPLKDNRYEILSGHNRANAGKTAGLEKVPVVIKDGLTDEEAMLIVTETNLIQRSFAELAHSEKARVLTERHKAIKQQGKRIDLINEIESLSKVDSLQENPTSCQFDKKLESNEKVGQQYDLSSSMVSRYLRIDTLIDELKERLDNEKIPFTSAVDLSFLKEDEQEIVEVILNEYEFKVDIKKSNILKTLSQGRNFNYDKAYEVLSGKFFEKPKKKRKAIKLKPKLVNKYFKENQSQNEIEETIEKALEMYFSQNQEIENNEEFEMA